MKPHPCAFHLKQWPRHHRAHAMAPSSPSWTRSRIRSKILVHRICWHHTKHVNSSKMIMMKLIANQLPIRWTTCSQQCRADRETAAIAHPRFPGSSPRSNQASWTRNLISSTTMPGSQTNILLENLVTPRAKISSQVIHNQTGAWSTRYCPSPTLTYLRSSCNHQYKEMRKSKPTWTRSSLSLMTLQKKMSLRPAEMSALRAIKTQLTKRRTPLARKGSGTKMALLIEGPIGSTRCFSPTKKTTNDFFNLPKVKTITINITATRHRDWWAATPPHRKRLSDWSCTRMTTRPPERSASRTSKGSHTKTSTLIPPRLGKTALTSFRSQKLL